MEILQSVMGYETDEEENVSSALNSDFSDGDEENVSSALSPHSSDGYEENFSYGDEGNVRSALSPYLSDDEEESVSSALNPCFSDDEEESVSSALNPYFSDGDEENVSHGDEEYVSSALNPYFSDGDEENVSHGDEEYVSSALNAYFSDGDEENVSHGDEEYVSSALNPYFSDCDEENIISARNSYSNIVSARNSYFNNGDEKLKHNLLSDQMKDLTISVPNLRNSSSLSHTTVDNKVQSSSVFIKETTPQNVHRQERIGNIGSYSGGKGKEEKQREEGQVRINLRVGTWIKHYCSLHQILLVGEGDFSFSTCLASTFDWASNMIATSLDSQAFLLRNYGNALSNLVELSSRKCKVMHEIDATEMANHPLLGEIKFDRIIFNFPYAGLNTLKNLPRDCQLLLHRELVSQFLKNAKEMLSESGEIHITHKTNGFHKEWNLVSLASSHRLQLVEAVDFSLLDYPGYNTKSGFGGDNNFDCYPSKTYKFGL